MHCVADILEFNQIISFLLIRGVVMYLLLRHQQLIELLPHDTNQSLIALESCDRVWRSMYVLRI